MNELKIFNHSEFGEIRVVDIYGEKEVWMVGKDVAAALGYTDTFGALKKHVDDEDKLVCQIDSAGQKRYVTVINESGLYALVLFSKLPGAKKFRRWVTSEVLPSIRKTGGYISVTASMSDDEIMARALVVANETIKRRNEQIKALEAENAAQRQAIADFEPVRQYVDTILASTRTLTTTQIAADYDMSAKKLNKILREEGIQRYVNGQWILYRKYMGKGYTKSKTINIIRSDGRPDTGLNTEWTQKGRLMIHEILEARGIQAVMDKQVA